MIKKFLIGAVAVAFVIAISAFLAPETLLVKVAEFLVYEDPLKPADAIVVLSGAKNGSRIKAGARLFREGLGKVVVFSGEEIYPNAYQHHLMENYAIEQGIARKNIITAILDEEISTWGEGIVNLKLLEEHGIKNFILVTSSYHTYRSQVVYSNLISKLGYDLKFSVYPAEDPSIPMKSWWKTRHGKKNILLEYLKTVSFLIEH